MANVVVVGSQWGDEGKGKIVDWLSERADVVVRFQGGHNAGHTLVVDGVTYKLSLLPSGVVRGGKYSIIGNGVVVDPWALLAEIETLRNQGVDISPENLAVAENATLILSVHRELDASREDSNSGLNIGTTRRGIGPAYEDKVGRRAIRVCDLADPDILDQKVVRCSPITTRSAQDLAIPRSMKLKCAQRLKRLRRRYCRMPSRCGCNSKSIGWQGAKFFSKARRAPCSTMTTAPTRLSPHQTRWRVRLRWARASGPGAIGYVLGITKAYTTRVGEGPFPSELSDETGQMLGERGNEFGTVTGRARRCGWFDAVLVRQAVKTGGIDGIALTKLDVLDGMPEIRICIGYRLDGKELHHLPASMSAQAGVEPIYETLEGWQESTRGARTWAALPATAIKYIRRVEELIEAPVALLSTSPEREDTILVHDPFRD